MVSVWVWRDLRPLLRRFCRESGLGFNRVVNLALEQFLGSAGQVSGELRLRVRLAGLMREECELRRQSRVMLRSGSFLPKYADRILRSHDSPIQQGQKPLRALSRREEEIFRRILARRDKIVKEIVGIQDRLLPKEKFRLAPKRHRRSRRRDNIKSVKNVRTREGDGS